MNQYRVNELIDIYEEAELLRSDRCNEIRRLVRDELARNALEDPKIAPHIKHTVTYCNEQSGKMLVINMDEYKRDHINFKERRTVTVGQLFYVAGYEICKLIVLGKGLIKDAWDNYDVRDLDLVIKSIEPDYEGLLYVFIDEEEYKRIHPEA